jgi:hypothetical protein
MEIPIEIVVTVLGALLTALGFLIVKILSAFSKNTDAFNSINESIQDIRLWITKKDTSDTYEEKECDFLHKSINARFENHEKRINYLEKK